MPKAKKSDVKVYQGKHAKSCECGPCLKSKIAAFKERLDAMSQMPRPEDMDHCIPVRAHWRRSSTYLSKTPKLRDAVLTLVRGIIKSNNVRGAA